jgi:hypothetical protein
MFYKDDILFSSPLLIDTTLDFGHIKLVLSLTEVTVSRQEHVHFVYMS